MQIVIDIPEESYKLLKNEGVDWLGAEHILNSVANGTPLTPDVLADLLMEERIRGKLKQDISYSKDVIPDVKCRLTVDIRDHRPCYCGAGLREVWRESEAKE